MISLFSTGLNQNDLSGSQVLKSTGSRHYIKIQMSSREAGLHNADYKPVNSASTQIAFPQFFSYYFVYKLPQLSKMPRKVLIPVSGRLYSKSLMAWHCS